jgi:cytochrome P450
MTAATSEHDQELQTMANFADPEFLADPYAAYARLRREAPVWWCRGSDSWIVTRYDDVRAVLCDSDTFSSVPQASNKYLELGLYEDPSTSMIIMLDDPAHQRVRQMFTRNGAYAKAHVEGIRPVFKRLCANIIDNLPAGEVEVVNQVALRAVIGLMKLFFDMPDPLEDEPYWGDALVGYYAPGADGPTAEGLHRYLRRMVRDRRILPGSDPVSAAVFANDRQQLLDDTQMAWNFFDAILAGAASTVAVAAESIHVLAQEPATQNPQFWNTRDAAKTSSEELLRYTSHIHMVTRTAIRDTEIDGQPIRQGDAVYVILSSANRDEHKWESGETLDLTRQSQRPNFAFGFGPHIATGVHLARMCLSTLVPAFVSARAPFTLSGHPIHARTRGISTPADIRVVTAA